MLCFLPYYAQYHLKHTFLLITNHLSIPSLLQSLLHLTTSSLILVLQTLNHSFILVHILVIRLLPSSASTSFERFKTSLFWLFFNDGSICIFHFSTTKTLTQWLVCPFNVLLIIKFTKCIKSLNWKSSKMHKS